MISCLQLARSGEGFNFCFAEMSKCLMNTAQHPWTLELQTIGRTFRKSATVGSTKHEAWGVCWRDQVFLSLTVSLGMLRRFRMHCGLWQCCKAGFYCAKMFHFSVVPGASLRSGCSQGNSKGQGNSGRTMDDGNQIQSTGVVPCRTTKALNKDVDVVVGALLIIKGCSFQLLITWCCVLFSHISYRYVRIVSSSASNWGNIQAKVKDLLIRWHPDKNPGCPEKAVGSAAKISLAMGVWFNIGEKKCVGSRWAATECPPCDLVSRKICGVDDFNVRIAGVSFGLMLASF